MKLIVKNKILCMALLAIIVFSLLGFTACSGSDVASSFPVSSSTTEIESIPSLHPAGTYSLGLGAQTAVMASSAVNEDVVKWPGVAEMFTTVCAVLLDSQGSIAEMRFDKERIGANFTAEGMLSTDPGYENNSYYDYDESSEPVLKSDFGYSWRAQIDAFCSWAVGRRPHDVLNMPLVAKDIPGSFVADEELSAVVTIDVSDMLHALQNALANAVEMEAENGVSRLGLTLMSQFSPLSADAMLDTDGEVIPGFVRFEISFGAMLLSNTGHILSVRFDAMQYDITFDGVGGLYGTNDEPTLTKVQKGDSYGMRRISAIGKEWFEQIAAFEQWLVGKTPAEVIALLEGSEQGLASDVDVVASVTIDISDFVNITSQNANRMR